MSCGAYGHQLAGTPHEKNKAHDGYLKKCCQAVVTGSLLNPLPVQHTIQIAAPVDSIKMLTVLTSEM